MRSNKDAELAYSTNAKETAKYKEKKSAPLPNSGSKSCKMRLESKGRGGKQVTVLFELGFSDPECKDLLKSLQSQLGTGGTYKDRTIEIRGDVRDRVAAYFTKMGWKLTRAGG